MGEAKRVRLGMRNILEKKRKKEKEEREIEKIHIYLLCSVIHSLEGVSHIQGLIGGGSKQIDIFLHVRIILDYTGLFGILNVLYIYLSIEGSTIYRLVEEKYSPHSK